MKKVLSVLFLLVMLFTTVMPMALAEDAASTATPAPAATAEPTIEPTAEPTKDPSVAPTAEPAPAEEDPLSIGEAALYMLKGMVGIFLVTGLIILVLVIMDKAGNRKKETEE